MNSQTTLIKSLKIVVTVFVLSLTANANAVQLVLEGGYRSGGENAITLVDIGGNSAELRAGGGLSNMIGINHQINDSMRIRALFGYVFSTISGREIFSNTTFEYKWSHYPLDTSFFKSIKRWHIGGGLTYHFNPELKGSGFFANKGVSYDNALGYLAEVDFRFNDRMYLGTKYTIIEYKNSSGGKTDGTNLGLFFGYTFGK